MFQLHFIEIQDPVFQRTIGFIFQRIFVLQTRIRLQTFINIHDDFGGFSPRQALDLCIDGKELRLPQRQSVHSIDRYNNITRIFL